MELKRISDCVWEIPKTGAMRVPGRIYADKRLLDLAKGDKALDQVVNVATLPGIVKWSLAMPDIHWGYGFPIGGVAAFSLDEGVISPGGVGYDINCGVRVCKTGLTFKELEGKHKKLVNALFNAVPTGVGGDSAIGRLSKADGTGIVTTGAKWAVEHGFGKPSDLDYTEDGGTMAGADPAAASDTAFKRGLGQVGTLGSGNHFLELDRVDETYTPEALSVFGLSVGDVVLLIHCGSRGFGYQICDENVHDFVKIAGRYHIDLADRQLACAPASSWEGKKYLSAMACAANYAWVNRQVIMILAGRALSDCLGKSVEPELIYDVCHNIAKIEDHEVDGKMMKVIVHRKGATRAFPAGHPLTPAKYKDVGQPVLVPGDMGRCSFLLTGLPGAMKETFGSTCHGAGRTASRGEMNRRMQGVDLDAELRSMGVTVRGKTRASLAEEMPSAYKDADVVTEVMERAGISKRIAKFVPFAVIKG
ncbi:MAG: RtcB family protein [Planctomycetes bacterium]|nr:RtcB family protein [Planctomycetota bacterium]